jgi:cytochrome c biogenesis protein CcmG/thiol:disulfide interchange protein DsbE
MHRTVAIATVLVLVNLAGRSARADETAAEGLPNDWKRTETIPAVEQKRKVVSREGRLTAWVEKGWLVVRRATADGEIEWQIVLARASNPSPPEVIVEAANPCLQVSYRGFFIRESPPSDEALPYRPIALRAFRERKTAASPGWPALELPESMWNGVGNAVRRKLQWNTRVLDSWSWIESGPASGGPDVWVRLAHRQIREIDPYAKGNRPEDRQRSDLSVVEFSSGTRTTNDGAAGIWQGSRHFQDEGDLLLVSRASFDTLSRALRNRNLRENFGTDEPPELTAQAWLNGAEPLYLDKLKGKVVLLDFWSLRSARSERQLSRVEELHKKYGPRGLVVIGIHPVEKLDVAGDVVKDKALTFPVMIDLPRAGPALNIPPGIVPPPTFGETAKFYLTEFYPNYFLIDKSGKLTWGFSLDPPTEDTIEGLLK